MHHAIQPDTQPNAIRVPTASTGLGYPRIPPTVAYAPQSAATYTRAPPGLSWALQCQSHNFHNKRQPIHLLAPPSTTHVKASDSEATPRTSKAAVCRRYTFPGIPRLRSGSDGRRALGAHNPMRAGGTRITPWLMLRTGFRCRRASATLVL